jgi:hypothetical protein
MQSANWYKMSLKADEDNDLNGTHSNTNKQNPSDISFSALT